MKKLFTLCLFILLLNAKSNAQTQFPFDGFELSNYQVGDTLEYHEYYYQGPPGIGDTYHDIFHVIGKEFISADTIKYTIEDTYHHFTKRPITIEGKDTLIRIVANDSIYNTRNNILGLFLEPMDTGYGNYFNYDTINGIKKLSIKIQTPFGWSSYVTEQNLGIKLYNKVTSSPFEIDDTLLYAHLAHYGIYGKYNPIILGINSQQYIIASISVRYINAIPVLFISSSQNTSSPTLTIYDLLGRTIKTKPVIIGSNPIDMHTLSKGIYLYKATAHGNILGQGKLMNL